MDAPYAYYAYYERVLPFQEGVAVVGIAEADGKGHPCSWGNLDTHYRELVPPQYDAASTIENGFAQIGKAQRKEAYRPGACEFCKYGFINKVGAIVIPLRYDLASDCSASGRCRSPPNAGPSWPGRGHIPAGAGNPPRLL